MLSQGILYRVLLLTELNEHEKEIAYYGTIGKGLELPDKSSHAYRQREVVSSKVKKTLSDEWSVRSKGRYNRSSKQRLKRNHTLAPLRLSECKTNFEQKIKLRETQKNILRR